MCVRACVCICVWMHSCVRERKSVAIIQLEQSTPLNSFTIIEISISRISCFWCYFVNASWETSILCGPHYSESLLPNELWTNRMNWFFYYIRIFTDGILGERDEQWRICMKTHIHMRVTWFIKTCNTYNKTMTVPSIDT